MSKLLATLLATVVAGPALQAAELLPLQIDARTRAWARDTLSRSSSAEDSLRHLMLQMVSPAGLGVREVVGHTPSAQEAFARRQADCAGFGFLFVALARAIDIPAHFVIFTDIESYKRQGDLRVAHAHMAAAYGPPQRTLVYDFGGRMQPGSRVRRISDAAAAAVYYSNRGVQHLLAGETTEAIDHLRAALRLDRRSAIAWTNLGVVLRRNGDHSGAERAYRRAVDIDPTAYSARRNLALLLSRQPGPTP